MSEETPQFTWADAQLPAVPLGDVCSVIEFTISANRDETGRQHRIFEQVYECGWVSLTDWTLPTSTVMKDALKASHDRHHVRCGWCV